MVHQAGLEPARYEPYASETYAYTNSATGAMLEYYIKYPNICALFIYQCEKDTVTKGLGVIA